MEPKIPTVLLLEDEEAHLELASEAFQEDGSFFVVPARTVAEARLRLADGGIDIVIADWLLPDGHGADLLRGGEVGNTVPVVLMTSHGSEKLAVDVMKQGALDYVVKSAGVLSTMPEVAKRALRQWEQSRALEAAERAQAESEARYRRLFEEGSDAVLLHGVDGRILDLNRQAEKLTGLTRAQLSAARLHALLRDDLQEGLGYWLDRLRAGVPARLETVFQSADGASKHVEISASIVDAESCVVQSIIRDITLRKEMEQTLLTARRELEVRVADRTNELREAHEKLQALNAQLEERVHRRTAQLEAANRELNALNRLFELLVNCNEALVRAGQESGLIEEVCRIIAVKGGYAAAWFAETDADGRLKAPMLYYGLGERGAALLREQAQNGGALWALTREAVSSSTPAIAEGVSIPAGLLEEEVRVDASSAVAIPLQWGDVLLGALSILALDADVFHAKEVELLLELGADLAYGVQALRVREEHRLAEEAMRRLATGIEQASEHILMLSPTGIIQYVNPAFEQSMRISREEAVGKSVGEVTGVPVAEDIQSVLRRGEMWKGTLNWFRNDGHPLELEASVVPVRTRTGEVDCFLSIQRDVTHERELEEQLRQSQKMEAMGTLAGGIAHDFNNILGAILGFAELAQQEVDEPEALLDDLSEILQAAHRAKELIAQILSFSRRGKQEKAPLMLQSVLKETAKFMRASIPTTIAMDVAIDNACPPVMGDHTAIHQVIMNLCTNAYQAIQEKGDEPGREQRLEIELALVELGKEEATVIRGVKPGQYVRLTVRDTGCGIPPEIGKRIFDPYFTTKTSGRGTGLGLSTVHSIVLNHDGGIQVESAPGAGTAFHIYFPPCAAARLEAGGLGAQDALPRGTERILVVDDEKPIVEVYRRNLTLLGYIVESHTSSEQALSAFLADPARYAAVVTDLSMPPPSGLELTRRMREAEPGARIILCTGYCNDQIESLALQAGIQEVILKPVVASRLANSLRRILDSASDA